MAKATYRVTVNGFTVLNPTWDDALNWDGKGDEVFLATTVKLCNKDGTVQYEQTLRSPVLGDIAGQNGRVQAGTLSRDGGLRGGDKFPDIDQPWRYTDLTDLNYPPCRVFEGEIDEDQSMSFISPTIWEYDPGESMWEGLLEWHRQTDDTFGKKAKEIFGKLWPVSAPVFDAVSLGIQTMATLPSGPLGQSAARPIGMYPDANDPNKWVFNPFVIPLTYENAERIVNTDCGLGPGILSIHYQDHPRLQGSYQLYVQVQRVGSQVQPLDYGHLYTASQLERDLGVSQGWTDEGIACYVYNAATPGTVPLFRLVDPANGDRLYTTSELERDLAVSRHGYTNQDVACYVYNAPIADTVPFFRATNPTNGDRFYTAAERERNVAVGQLGYTDEGIACYVYNNQTEGTVPLFRLVKVFN